MMKTAISTTLFAMLLFGMSPVHAIEPLTAKQLHEICIDDGELRQDDDGRLCLFYIKGFLDGAVATDARVAENVADEADSETFAERAIRTRVINRLEKYGPTVYGEFCIGEPDPIVDVLDHVVERLAGVKDLDQIQAQMVVYGALREHYPCPEE